ncbi:MAG: maltose O-acetyltransferase [Nitrospirales bacterium]|nr:MAG: maltose O-acetyltransferase [Nitrospirales bacterium]
MSTEKQKMLKGELYNGTDLELVEERQQARLLCQQLNALPATAPEADRQVLLAALFQTETDAYITPPFFCDYGYNIRLGTHAYFNFNCVLLDVMPISIGNHVLFGPGVHIYTALHPLSAHERRSDLEFAKPVTIGDDVWVGGGAIICPGIVIGDGTVIGAGSVVTRDVKAGVVAAGNPCRVIRKI